jgi:hypothetical protein
MKSVELCARVRHAVLIEGIGARAAADRFGINPRTVAKMLTFSVPPGYIRSKPPFRPKLNAFIGVIDAMLAADRDRPKKQRHTSKRIFERLRDELQKAQHESDRVFLGQLNPKNGNFQIRSTYRGAARGTRTPDPIITNDVLYQLSYCGEPAFGGGTRPIAPVILLGKRVSSPRWELRPTKKEPGTMTRLP